VTEISIYVEGGGDTAQQKAELRNGFDELLISQKQAARSKRLRWKLVPSGGRDAAYKDFMNALRQADGETLCVLLVDSEDELHAELPKSVNESPEDTTRRKLTDALARRNHIVNRDDWNLSGIPPEHIHLMVRCMEAWIVSDPDKLARHYGQWFHASSLPTRPNLEDEAKASLYDKLQKATRDTSKGEYAKIKHASKLLGLIDPKKVAARCPRFATFTSWLDEQIKNA
jgi:hypothetical protein